MALKSCPAFAPATNWCSRKSRPVGAAHPRDINSPLTPLFLLAGLALGLIALVALPREEEPQISVPMVDIFVSADGLKADDAVKLVTEPLETIVKAINGVEHVYSNTVDDRVVVTARFLVGTSPDNAILRVHEKIRANYDRIPTGIPEPLIVGRGIDDVAIVTLTLAPKPGVTRFEDNGLYHMAEDLQVELAKLEDVGLSYIVGGRPDQIRIEPDPEKLSLYGITLAQLVDKVREANRAFLAGEVRENNRNLSVTAGQTLQGIPDIGFSCYRRAMAGPSMSTMLRTWSSAPSRSSIRPGSSRAREAARLTALLPSRSLLPSAPVPMPSSFPSAFCTASPS